MKTPGDPLLLILDKHLFDSSHRGAADLLAETIADAGDDTGPRSSTEVGSTLGENYRVVDVRRGGMGEVFICERVDGSGQFKIALKTFQKRLFFRRSSRHAFAREVAVWMRLTGLPHIMPALGLEYIAGRPFVRMPAVPENPEGGVSVRDLVNQGPLPESLAFQVAFQTAYGLATAEEHVKGLVHGDLKPDNLLVMQDNVYISDFGMARVLADLREADPLRGTFAYLAPECWKPGTAPSSGADVYAFGVLMTEVLTSSLPFNLSRDTEDEWARVHRDAKPCSARRFEPGGLADRLLALAFDCMAKDPADRPAGFPEVLERLNDLGRRHDVLLHFMTLVRSLEIRARFEQLQTRDKPMLIEGLLQMDEIALALKELEAVPEDRYDARLWGLKGTTLSLSGDDVGAILCLDKALALEPEPDVRHGLLIDRGLSLKRLGRYDEAIHLFESLYPEVAESRLHAVVTNLATVYARSGRIDDCIERLESFLRYTPDVPEAWANLGMTYQRKGKPEQALKSFQRALAIAPHMARVQVSLASLHMQYGHFDEAIESLKLAHDQGLDSEELFARLLVCYLMTRRVDEARDTFKAAKSQLSENTWNAIADALSSPTPDRVDSALQALGFVEATAGATEPDVGEDQEPAHSDPADVSALGGDPGETLPAADADASEPPDSGPEAGEDRHVPKLPYVNARISFDDSTYAIDYYDHIGEGGFVDRLRSAWLTLKRQMPGYLELRTILPYFTRCPACGFTILTNRDEGAKLRCYLCKECHETRAEINSRLDALLASAYEALELAVVDLHGYTVIVLLQPRDDVLGELEPVWREAGFDRIEPLQLHTSLLLSEAVRRGALDLDRPYAVIQKTYSESAWSFEDKTPPDVDRLIRQFRRTVDSPIFTADQPLPPGSVIMDKDIIRGIGELSDKLRGNPDDAPARSNLCMLLMEHGRHREARDLAVAGTRIHRTDPKIWENLGIAEMELGNYADAIPALSQSLQLDPINRQATYCLILCLEKTGRTSEAMALAIRLRNLGGGPF